jgi:predicted secreted protein
MGEHIGREVQVFKAATRVLGLQEKGIAHAGELIDLTNDDDDGYARMHTKYGRKQITITLSGMPTSDMIKNSWMAMAAGTEDVVGPWRVVYPSGAELAGDFALKNWDETEPFEDKATCSFELQSSGPWIWTPAP